MHIVVVDIQLCVETMAAAVLAARPCKRCGCIQANADTGEKILNKTAVPLHGKAETICFLVKSARAFQQHTCIRSPHASSIKQVPARVQQL